jgi:hypothetical protein
LIRAHRNLQCRDATSARGWTCGRKRHQPTPRLLGAPAGDGLRFQLLDSELCEQQALRRFEILEGNRFVVETLVQRSEIGEHIILGTLRGQGLFLLR